MRIPRQAGVKGKGLWSVLLASMLLLGPGRPSASAAGTAPTYGAPQQLLQLSETAFAVILASADFNGDGLMDVVVARAHYLTSQVFPLTILLNNGSGGFVDATSTIPPAHSQTAPRSGVFPLDVPYPR